MAVTKRCIFCKKPLREDGYCENKNCVDYKRTEIHDKQKKEKNNN